MLDGNGVLTPEDVEGAAVKEASQLLDLYLQTRGKETRRNYRAILADWLEFQNKRHWIMKYRGFLRPTRTDCLSYLQAVRDRGAKESTITHKVAVLRLMYSWLVDNGYIEQNPWLLALPKPQEDTKQAEALHPDDVRKMLECWGASFDELLQRAIITLLFACGLRRSEIPSLLAVDVRLGQEPQITLRKQKNRKQQALPIPHWAVPALVEYRQQRDEKYSDGPHEFFLKGGTHKKPQVSDCYVKRAFKLALKRAGLPVDMYSCHSARATAITELLKLGINHREVQEFSRHASVRMVEKYDRRRYGVSQNPGLRLKY